MGLLQTLAGQVKYSAVSGALHGGDRHALGRNPCREGEGSLCA